MKGFLNCDGCQWNNLAVCQQCVSGMKKEIQELKAENERLRADNERLRGHLDKHKSGVATSAYALGREDARLQDAVNGAEKASERIDDWPEWKKSMAYRHHDTDGDKE